MPFTIIADEVTDTYSNQEVLSVCIRFVDLCNPKTPQKKGCLVNLINLERANASTISSKILESLSHPSVALNPHNIRGQAYDGAAVMSSHITGVQAKIKEILPLAVYTHCFAHSLNLSIAASCDVQEVRNLIGLNESYFFLSNSPKRQSFFERAIKVYLPESHHSKLPGLCKTPWVERHTCYEVFLEMYVCFVTFLDAIITPSNYPDLLQDGESWNWDRETKTKAQGLKSSLSSFQTIAVFITTKNILDEVRSLASKLQKRDKDVVDAYQLVQSCVQAITNRRHKIDEVFASWYASDIHPLADSVGVCPSVPRKTSLQRNRTNVPSNSPLEHFKRAVAIPLIDSLLQQLQDRFSSQHSHVKNLFLVPSILTSYEEPFNLQSTLEGLKYWNADLPLPSSLENELRRWNALWMEKQATSESSPDNLLKALASCDQDSFPNIHSILVIACTLPISSAEAERSFSLLRRIKTYPRSTMSEERLSDLSIIAMH